MLGCDIVQAYVALACWRREQEPVRASPHLVAALHDGSNLEAGRPGLCERDPELHMPAGRDHAALPPAPGYVVVASALMPAFLVKRKPAELEVSTQPVPVSRLQLRRQENGERRLLVQRPICHHRTPFTVATSKVQRG